MHCFPAAYNHLLHRTSLYLGNWTKLETGRIAAAFYNQWSAASLWPGTAMVQLTGEMLSTVTDAD